ncbi:hypothetical protein AVEN_19124-1 [Araneus ventricosus]|uniref:Uncharacterized protein n=1 Tax=Araneus ventricosus TaxID=182803 RepID=A0A4Y2UVA2_ARAVE|nr:hypothetical protein AVEN_19124-1 [Araneus ventricosus]
MSRAVRVPLILSLQNHNCYGSSPCLRGRRLSAVDRIHWCVIGGLLSRSRAARSYKPVSCWNLRSSPTLVTHFMGDRCVPGHHSLQNHCNLFFTSCPCLRGRDYRVDRLLVLIEVYSDLSQATLIKPVMEIFNFLPDSSDTLCRDSVAYLPAVITLSKNHFNCWSHPCLHLDERLSR